MKRYRVVILPEAEALIEEQFEYIASDSVERALAWADRLRVAIRAIGEHPGYAVDEEATARVRRETRKMSFEGTYLVHFQIREDADLIEVVGFRHGARQPRRGEP